MKALLQAVDVLDCSGGSEMWSHPTYDFRAPEGDRGNRMPKLAEAVEYRQNGQSKNHCENRKCFAAKVLETLHRKPIETWHATLPIKSECMFCNRLSATFAIHGNLNDMGESQCQWAVLYFPNVPHDLPRKAGGRGALAARVPACRG